MLGTTGLVLTKGNTGPEPAGKQMFSLGTLFISGFHYYDMPEAENLFEAGMPLHLNRHPTVSSTTS